MKTTEHFKNTIKKYLDDRAFVDALFAEKYRTDKKNILEQQMRLFYVKNAPC